MIDCCKNLYLYAMFCTFRIGPEEEDNTNLNDYKEYINEYIIYVQDYDEKKEIISIIGYKFLTKNMYFEVIVR